MFLLEKQGTTVPVWHDVHLFGKLAKNIFRCSDALKSNFIYLSEVLVSSALFFIGTEEEEKIICICFTYESKPRTHPKQNVLICNILVIT